MKFMKLGSKPDSFQANGNVRRVVTELVTDIIVNVGDVKFHLHKFPLLSKSGRLHKLLAAINDENEDEIHIPDIPGGAMAFEICAKFCYGMTVTLNAYNVVAGRCAAEYLEMLETIEKGNLVYKIDVFLASSIFRSWKDSIIVLQTAKSFTPWCEDLKIVGRCIDAIASRASIDPSKVEWSYTYNCEKIPSENANDPQWNGMKKQVVPKDWWAEDLCELEIDLYKRVIAAIKAKGKVSSDTIGVSLNAYASRKIPGFVKGMIQAGNVAKSRLLIETIIWMLPIEARSISCSFLLKLLKAATLLDCSEMAKKELVKRISRQLDEASVTDLLIPAQGGESKNVRYDADIVQNIVAEFLMQERSEPTNLTLAGELQEIRSPLHGSSTANIAVAKLVDGYLAEIARDPNLPLSKFIDLAEMMSNDSHLVHDGLYRAIDMYLKEHPGLSKGEKKRICKLMDCKKLSVEASMHAAQNERLPLRVIVQVLFCEQLRAAGSAAGVGLDIPRRTHTFLPVENSESYGSSRSGTTNTEEDCAAAAAAALEVHKSIKGDLMSMRLVGGRNETHGKINGDRHVNKLKDGIK